ncbi:hypothetical protein A2755_00020 [Candidatus Wolfebacteria bacterium RIFCSPHIGHO2_01_FULL_48_22]|uniref:LamG-like jellyroll fold domain-containing protein n=1 Tax=Candidatus Wolfebacteria bacterium RIFCSPHIGHO2_01_FULL_48_22 TaxID=1802555 RepID=A0A1F8DR38_9BACT|nr:MAG: hypothetical protein A2755_00020 [Candidatus Wolfebacteria bacterium RIFCSPHIGHO2_01_FULL_48_22]
MKPQTTNSISRLIHNTGYLIPAIVICGLFFGILSSTADAATLIRPPNNLGLVGYWPMNEATSTIAGDYSGNGNNGTLTGMAFPPTSTSGWTNQGKRGGAINFDGVDDYVDVGSSTATQLTGSMTLSAWFKITANGGDDNDIVTKYYGDTARGWQLKTTVDCGPRTIAIHISSGGTSHQRCGSKTLSLNTWYHATGVYDASALTLDVYLNGSIDNGTLVGGAIPSSQDDAGSPVEIGCRNQTALNPCWSAPPNLTFNGAIDDVRIYNRALSAAEVKALYQSGAVAINSSQNNRLKDGLVGLWSFNGGDMNGNTAYDRSGNNNNGTLTNGPTRAIGKIGQALSFDGVDDYVQVNQPIYQNNTSYSISFWMKSPAQATGNIKSIYAEAVTSGSAYLRLASWPGASPNQLRVVIRNDAAVAVLAVYSTTIVFNDTWHHIAWTDANGTAALYIDGVRDASNFNYTRSGVFTLNTSTIGAIVDSGPDDFLQSKIDDVRIYNRALSASEIKALYQSGAAAINSSQNNRLKDGLVGLWSFNGGDMNGNTAYDRSGNNNNGTLTNGPTRAIGKIGQALSFGGVDDYVAVSSANSVDNAQLTYSAWIYRTGSAPSQVISTGIGTTAHTLFYILGTPPGVEFSYIWTSGICKSATAAGAVSLNNWYHIVVTYDRSLACSASTVPRIYVNGVQVGAADTTNGTSGALTGTNAVNIGTTMTPSNYFPGLIDDVRIYNRALSEQEVKQLYLMGK